MQPVGSKVDAHVIRSLLDAKWTDDGVYVHVIRSLLDPKWIDDGVYVHVIRSLLDPKRRILIQKGLRTKCTRSGSS